jgi:hypothetical protein
MEERGRIIDRFYVVFGPRKVETAGVYIPHHSGRLTQLKCKQNSRSHIEEEETK